MAVKIFISSVQSEFSQERKQLFDYIREDALLSQFFEPYIFEETPAMDVSASHAYLSEVRDCDIYLGLFGFRYGYEDAQGISPTEREFDLATQCGKLRLVYITRPKPGKKRHPKEAALIAKAEQTLVRKSFGNYDELQEAVYRSLVRYLIETNIVRKTTFDDAVCRGANIDEIDPEKIRHFVMLATASRGFPVPISAGIVNILTHLGIMTQSGELTNAAILLFGREPQRYFPAAIVKCAHFYGTTICKPVPSHQQFTGTVFEVVDKAVDFVMSRLNNRVGTRAVSNSVSVTAEIPREAVSEAIVNAVVHRDYTSNAAVQVMVFRDRVEIWNPGTLPFGLNTERLETPHYSVPHNPRIATVTFLAGYIEQLGTGTTDIVEMCTGWGLKKPLFSQQECFKVTLWRAEDEEDEGPLLEAGEDCFEDYHSWIKEHIRFKREERTKKQSEQRTALSKRRIAKSKQSRADVAKKQSAVIEFCCIPRSSMEIMQHIGVSRQTRTVNLYIGELIKEGRLRALLPDKPNSPRQRYIAAEI